MRVLRSKRQDGRRLALAPSICRRRESSHAAQCLECGNSGTGSSPLGLATTLASGNHISSTSKRWFTLTRANPTDASYHSNAHVIIYKNVARLRYKESNRTIAKAADAFCEIRTEHFLSLCDRARRESSHGLVLMLGESLSETLADLLTEVAVDSKIARSQLDWRGFFGSFAARIKVAYLFGIIKHRDYLFLEGLRRLRNDATHQHISLSSPAPSTAKCLARLPIRDPRTPPHGGMTAEENVRMLLLLHAGVYQGIFTSTLEIISKTEGIPDGLLIAILAERHPAARRLVDEWKRQNAQNDGKKTE